MGQDYSYSQSSSSSDEYDITSLIQAEAQLYVDEAQSSFDMAETVQYPPQLEADDGIPTICYCGSEPVVATTYTFKDPGRRYFTCDNVDDGDCHIWKWWDVAVMEEMRDFQTQLRRLKEQGIESEQKLVLLEKTVSDRPTNIGNLLGIRNDVRDRRIHEQLKNDLIEHIWNKFGNED
ncbi:hypothetical protein Bca4012_056987 [Brassica carinata]